MSEEQIKKIFTQLEDHEKRIANLEGVNVKSKVSKKTGEKKEVTLAEILHGKNLRSNEKVLLLVGYKEKILNQGNSSRSDIRSRWVDEKIKGEFRSNLIDRAKKAGLIREVKKNSIDLSSTGEEGFKKLLSDEPPKTTSK